jgi:hypothetical protein
MNKIKSFEDILKEKDYKYTGKNEISKLDSACKEYISINGATWYSDFKSGLNVHLNNLFYSNQILKYSFDRWQIRKAHAENTPEAIEKVNREIQETLEYKGEMLLRNFREKQQNSFEVNNIYGILRKFYGIEELDKIEFAPHKNLVNKNNFEQMKNKTAEFSKKIMHMKEGKYSSENSINRMLGNLTPEGNYYGYGNHGNKPNDMEFLAQLYIKTASKLPIAYFNETSAVKFFEKETGINVSKPKTNTIYRFGM